MDQSKRYGWSGGSGIAGVTVSRYRIVMLLSGRWRIIYLLPGFSQVLTDRAEQYLISNLLQTIKPIIVLLSNDQTDCMLHVFEYGAYHVHSIEQVKGATE